MSASDAAVAAQIDARKIARNLAVPTSDPKVRSRLRELGEPITCFGEREMDRRERLRSVLAKLVQSSGDGGDAQIEDEEESSSDSEVSSIAFPLSQSRLKHFVLTLSSPAEGRRILHRRH